MTEVMHTPPALRWVALFLAVCAVLGLFLGFRDQIRKNPPGWYTGAEQIATPLPATADGAREAVAFDPDAPSANGSAGSAPVVPATPPKASTPAADQATAQQPDGVSPPSGLSPATSPNAPRPKAAAATPATKTPTRPAPSGDPVGDILEGQKQTEAPDTVPY